MAKTIRDTILAYPGLADCEDFLDNVVLPGRGFEGTEGMEGDFADKKDEATFYYSYDKKTWKRIGEPCKMVFDYTKFFMGSKFAIFNYATKDLGGYVDIDYFEYGN